MKTETTPPTETVVKTAFLDTTDTLKSGAKGGWSKFGPRRLLHYAIQMMSMICEAADSSSKKALWEEVFFVKNLCRGMQRRGNHPDSRPILWKTCPTRFIRYEQLKPQIIGNMLAGNDLPTCNKRKRNADGGSPAFDFVATKLKRDNFFRWLYVKGQGPLLNNILIGRFILGIKAKFESKNANLPAWQERYSYIATKGKLNLGNFWTSTRQFEQAVKDFIKQKHLLDPEKVKRYKVNKINWGYPGDGSGFGPIHLFSYPEQVEDRMNKHLEGREWEKAIIYAQQGFLTDKFLSFLILLKKCHTGLREECAGTVDDIATKEEVLATFDLL
jgi:hypothetical protein